MQTSTLIISTKFESGNLELLKRQFGTKRVYENRAYQDCISERNHLHMNSTQWETLTDFVKCLGREGKCVVDETEKGWHAQYIDHDPETIAIQEGLVCKEKMMAFIEKQIEKGKECSKNDTHVFTEFVRPPEEQKVVVNLKVETKSDGAMKNETLVAINNKDSKGSGRRKGEKRKLSALDEIIKDEENKRERINRRDYWLVNGIVVKVIGKSLVDKYYRNKGVVTGVPDKYLTTVAMLDSGHKLKLDQEHLETVIPAIGRPVCVVNGAYRGCSAILRELDQKKFCVTIEISSGP
ncbi:DNA/RNA-binding protein KIN17 [Cryptotermes secundus]|uniref:DNA/RNA-binding protein KIN17 n=1 Tax=Cryptotermes secundus TaxID=105785 RepID=A0A2J7Q5M8_9NEOP|nr:DNA/RNA-binding protein KIN17 [Cryptotermes secundus]